MSRSRGYVEDCVLDSWPWTSQMSLLWCIVPCRRCVFLFSLCVTIMLAATYDRLENFPRVSSTFSLPWIALMYRQLCHQAINLVVSMMLVMFPLMRGRHTPGWLTQQPGLICCQLSRAPICACLATCVCVGSVTLELWVMRGTCSWNALLSQISETSTLHWLQSVQVSWLGLCGPETSPWSAGTSLLALIGCHVDDRQTLFHPFSLVDCQG